MKNRRYYELENENRINKIKFDNENSRTSELVKYFVGNEDKSLDSLLDNVIEFNNISDIKKEVKGSKLSIHPMYIDLIKEFYELNESSVNEIDKEWISSFKSLANKIVWKIRLEKNKTKNHEFHLHKCLLVGIQL